MTLYVYGLAEAGGKVRYVGKSKDPQARFLAHQKSPASAKLKAWVHSVDAQIELKILQECPTAIDAAVAEHEWIIRLGPGLLNVSKALGIRTSERTVKFTGLGLRCVQRRVSIGKSRATVCREAEISPDCLSRLESGLLRPALGADTAVALARSLRCSVEWLVTGEDGQSALAAAEAAKGAA